MSARGVSYVEEIRAHFASEFFILHRLPHMALRRLGLDRASVAGVVLAGAIGFAWALIPPLALTAATGSWSEVPWGRWLIVAGMFATFAVVLSRASDAEIGRETASMTALLPTVTDDSGLQRLAAFTRRWFGLRWSAAFGAALAALILLGCLLVVPDALRDLPIGSVGVLALILYEIGETAFFSVFSIPFIRREATLDHRLFWLSPADSEPVRQVLAGWGQTESARGFSATVYIVLAAVVVPLDSSLLLPLVVGIVASGYVMTFASMVALRSAIRTIATRVRDQHLLPVQIRIDAYGSRLADLSDAELEHLERLIALRSTLAETPTSPSGARTLGHAVTALIIPTLAFFLTLLSEFYAERLLGQVLP